ncbi:LysM peptidoglycan-binding domain-containing protein [Synechococcus sp. CBW1107]|uniref:LysM peptidoglycan-binding domain-containing protein n=1 Tax=Synechococcus sp. CBW1107 TaxID=2789857 RepID=UPI002AD1DD40|nr:LysM peptidoglycan-binding domain-containing protein [Synechococcus sp. CBW1107]CAK6700792.1 hypothetical protein IFHNHDMJ_02920 [Synechococcus sp. CBW1107]
MRRPLAALVLALALPMPSLAAEVVVKPGETLSEIASRHGISLTRLMQINGIRNADQVEAGRRLTVPSAPSTGRSTASGGSVTVKPGESLSEIADRHGVSLSRLMQINGIRNADHVEAGRRLALSSTTSRSGSSSAAPPPAGSSISVQPGETLSEIADRHGTSVSRLLQLNRLADPDRVEAGTRLVLPAKPVTKATAKPAAPARTYDRKASEHVVRSGESLSQIADGYGISLTNLVAINRITDPNHVEAGSRLRLKGTAAPTPKPAAPRPAAAPRPPASQASTSPQTTSASTATAKPVSASQPVAAAQQAPAAQPAPAAQVATATPAVKPVPAKPAAAQPIQAKATTATAAAKPSQPDWRTYGPLQVDWANWQPMGGSFVTPSLNGEGQPLYLAINCSARRLNATGQSGQWKSWDPPQSEFEQQLITDLCKTRTS